MNNLSHLPPITPPPTYQNIQPNRPSYSNNDNISNLYNQYLSQRSQSANEPSNIMIMNEIKSIKQIIKTQFENQNELQSKIIDYNKIISQQENIIRLNNLKLSEHDTKLTDILLSFSNFLKYQEKTNNILNSCQENINNNLVTKKEFSEFKNFVVGFKQNLEEQIQGIYHFKSDLLIKLSEIKEENKNYQQYTIDKIKSIQNQSDNSIMKFQNDNLQNFKNQKDVLNAQITQVKGLIQLVELNINEESKSRKFSIDKFYSDLKQNTDKIDEKFAKYEKSALETEKNLISLSKDYLSGFQELISKQKEKFETEMKSLRSLFEAGLVKSKNEYELSIQSLQDNITSLQETINEHKANLDEIDVFVKENIKDMNTKTDEADNRTKTSKLVVDALSKEHVNIMNKANEMIKNKLDEFSSEYSKKMDKIFNELKVENKIINDDHEKKIKDLFDRSSQIQSILNNYTSPSKGEFNEEEKAKIEEKIKELSNIVFGMENKFKEEVNNKNEETKDTLFQKINSMSASINDYLSKKVEVIQNDLKAHLDKYDKISEGKIQSNLVESENRIMERYDQEIIQIKEAIEKLILDQQNGENLNKMNNSINPNKSSKLINN